MKRIYGANMLWKVCTYEETEGETKEWWNEAGTGRKNETDIFTYKHTHRYKHALALQSTCFTQKLPQTLLHTEVFSHRCFYTQKFLRTHSVAHSRFYTQKVFNTDIFTHRHFLHTAACTHRHFYTQFVLTRHRSLYAQTSLHKNTF